MYGWTDPIDPESVAGHPGTPTGQPPYRGEEAAMPRSSYLFGDEPDEPGAGRFHETGGPGRDWTEAPTRAWPGESRATPTPVGGPVGGPATRSAPRAEVPVADGRHRSKRGASRPLLIAGAAAVATLVVSLTVGALALPDDSPPQPAPAAIDDAAPARPDLAAPEALGSPSASPTPGAVTPSPSPTRTTRATPTPSRTTTASRRAPRTTAPAGGGTASVPRGSDSREQQVVNLVNQERARAGCAAVTVNAKLANAARLHSADQAEHQKMSHDGSDGSDFVTRARRAGYDSPIGENVAMGYPTPEAVMQGWMNSDGHRRNILNCNARAIGVGVAPDEDGRLYWTQVFGSRA